MVLAVLGLGRSLLCLLLHLCLGLGLVVAHAREAAPAARVLCTRAATCALRAVRDAGPQGVGWERGGGWAVRERALMRGLCWRRAMAVLAHLRSVWAGEPLHHPAT